MREERMEPVDMKTLWGNGIDLPLTDSLEEFFERNEVGYDAVSSWTDDEMPNAIHYDLLSWYTLDDPFMALSSGITKPPSRGTLSFTGERVDYINSIYWSWGGDFRYDLPI